MHDGDGGNREGPTLGVVCYGSLLSPDELVPFLDGDGSRAVTVRVDGFRRVFNQRSVWRAGASESNGSAVLNAIRDDSWINAVLVPELSRQEYDALRRRERGYRMVEVEESAIEAYGEEDPCRDDILLIATGKEENVDGSLNPIPEYVDICLKGARARGDGFYNDFLNTTYVDDDRTLREYIDTGFSHGSF